MFWSKKKKVNSEEYEILLKRVIMAEALISKNEIEIKQLRDTFRKRGRPAKIDEEEKNIKSDGFSFARELQRGNSISG